MKEVHLLGFWYLTDRTSSDLCSNCSTPISYSKYEKKHVYLVKKEQKICINCMKFLFGYNSKLEEFVR